MRILFSLVILLVSQNASTEKLKLLSKQRNTTTELSYYSEFSKDNKFVYMSSLNHGISVFNIENKDYQLLQNLRLETSPHPSVSGVVKITNKIQLSPTEDYIYTSTITPFANEHGVISDAIQVYKRDAAGGLITKVKEYYAWDQGYKGLEKIVDFRITEDNKFLIAISAVGGISTFGVDSATGGISPIDTYDINNSEFSDFSDPTDFLITSDGEVIVISRNNKLVYILSLDINGTLTVKNKVALSVNSPQFITRTNISNEFLIWGDSEIIKLKLDTPVVVSKMTILAELAEQMLPAKKVQSLNNEYVVLAKSSNLLNKVAANGSNIELVESFSHPNIDNSNGLSVSKDGSLISLASTGVGTVAILDENLKELMFLGIEQSELRNATRVMKLSAFKNDELFAYNLARNSISHLVFDTNENVLLENKIFDLDILNNIENFPSLSSLEVSPDDKYIYTSYSAGDRYTSGVLVLGIDANVNLYLNQRFGGEDLGIDDWPRVVLADWAITSGVISIAPDGNYVYIPHETLNSQGSKDITLEVFSRNTADGSLAYINRYVDEFTKCSIGGAGKIKNADNMIHTKDGKFLYINGESAASILRKNQDGSLECYKVSDVPYFYPDYIAITPDEKFLVASQNDGLKLLEIADNGDLNLAYEWSLDGSIQQGYDNAQQILIHPSGKRVITIVYDENGQVTLVLLGLDENTKQLFTLETFTGVDEEKFNGALDIALSRSGKYLHIAGLYDGNIWNFELTESKPVESPSINASQDLEKKIDLNWHEVANTQVYKVFSSDMPSGNYELLAETTAMKYTHDNLADGSSKFYKVSACNEIGCAESSSYVEGKTKVAAEPIPPASSPDGSGGGGAANSVFILLMLLYWKAARLFRIRAKL